MSIGRGVRRFAFGAGLRLVAMTGEGSMDAS